MSQPAWDIKYAQHNLEQKLRLTHEERAWIHRNNQIPSVRTFWTAYKRALNFIHDTDRVNHVRKHLKFLRQIIKSEFSTLDPKLIIPTK